MKILLFALCFATFSVSAATCPELAGTYACSPQDQELVITQNLLSSGETEFINESSDIPVIRTSSTPRSFTAKNFGGFYQATCTGLKMELNLIGTISKTQTLHIKSSLSLDAEGSLIRETHSTLNSVENSLYEVCKRLK